MLIDNIENRTGNSGSKFKNGDTLFARITPCIENGKTGYVQFLPSCELYIINTSTTEPDRVWVTEVWRSQAEHDASLTIEGAQAAIKQVLPLLAGSPEKIDVLPVGGKGFTLA